MGLESFSRTAAQPQRTGRNRPLPHPTVRLLLHDPDRRRAGLPQAVADAGTVLKLEATNNLIKVIKQNAFGFRNFNNFKTRILIALNIKKERTDLVLSRL